MIGFKEKKNSETPARSGGQYYPPLQHSALAPLLTMKKESQVRFWCFTYNNYEGVVTAEDFGPHVSYLIFQEELSESSTPHLQGYVEFKRSMKFGQVRKMLPEAHWEPRVGTAAHCIAYCSKQDATYVAGPYEWGRPSTGQGSRSDIKLAYEDVKKGSSLLKLFDDHTSVAFKYPRSLQLALTLHNVRRTWKTEVFYLYGLPGVGKSTWCRTQAGPDFYSKQPNSIWFDGYFGQDSVLFDDLTAGWFPWSNLMQLLDAGPLLVQTKGGQTSFLARKLYITSNKTPDALYRSADGTVKHPLDALLRRIDHYIVMRDPVDIDDRGCPRNFVGSDFL